jgi:hypothetical protein
MTPSVIKEPATSTEEHAEYRGNRDVSAMRTQVATGPTGSLCAERLNLLVVTGKAIGWVAGFFTSTTSRRGAVCTAAVARPLEAGNRIAALCEEVDEMRWLQPDWNGYASEPPNEFGRDLAKQILLTATNILVPNRVAPSAQGGVGICFYRGNKYADVECLNTGEILATTSDGTGRPQVWEVKPSEVKGALERLGQFIAS